MQLSVENHRWLDDFKARYGRPPRILHVGNIANNAYNNAKLLNEAGLDCDVICYDYYHIMGCPEWEDAEFEGKLDDQFRPDWSKIDLRGFERPPWFAQGPVRDCIDYLVARREGNTQKAKALWSRLAALNGTKTQGLQAQFNSYVNRGLRAFRFCIGGRRVASTIASTCDQGRIAIVTTREVFRMAAAWSLLTLALITRVGGWIFVWLARKINVIDYSSSEDDHSFDSKVAELIENFEKAFPSRADALVTSDLETYRHIASQWGRLFMKYDLVQAYATDPILPMVAGKRPFIGFEHGTLRSHTLCNDPICRLTSLGYHLADHVFITNGDCLDYARRIGVTRFTPMLHPVDERRIGAIEGCYKELHSELGVRYVFLCTLRHDWKIKGTAQYIRALPELAKKLGRDFRVIMVRWGAELDRSMALAEFLGVADLILWNEPLPRLKLIRTLKSIDVLFDQIALPHFGATAPEGIAAGVPVIMSYDPKSTEWLVPEPAPILPAYNAAEIAIQVLRALDPVWLEDYRCRAAKWFDAYHSSRIVVKGHMDVFSSLIPDQK